MNEQHPPVPEASPIEADLASHFGPEPPEHAPPTFLERLRSETVGGALLLLGAVVALVWANSPWRGAYQDLSAVVVGPHSLHLDLSLATWAADGLLAIFFFVVGVELKFEIVAGTLRHPARAALPIVAAVGGMAVPALLFTAVVAVSGTDALEGWAVPTATDIAFAVAVLAVVGRGLHPALRTFLLTLAVVDDLLAITVIAVFYTGDLQLGWLALALVPLALFALLVQRRMLIWWLLVPLAVITWALVHASGIHATVAGVLLGFTVPALLRSGEHHPATHRVENAVRMGKVLARPLDAGAADAWFAALTAGLEVER